MDLLDPAFLLVAGPGLLFAMAVAETSVPAGLLVPAGVALALGAFLASQGHLPLPIVLLASGSGALVGDSVGYWLGRKGFARLLQGDGFAARMGGRYEGFTSRLYRRRALAAVSLARTISFVRTLMPATAGMSGMSYPRFLAFDVLGILAWLGLYTGVGILAGESWRVASTLVGTGWAAVILVAVAVAWVASRLRRQRTAAMALLDPGAEEEEERGPPSPLPS